MFVCQKRYLSVVKKIILFAIIIFCFSCSGKKETRLYVVFDHISEISEHTTVLINGVKSGEVETVSLNDQYKPLLTIKLNEGVKIPLKSEFMLGAADLMNKAVLVLTSSETDYYHDGDTVNGTLPKSLSEAIKEIPDSVKAMGRKTLQLFDEGLRVLGAAIEQAKQPNDTITQKAIDMVIDLPVVKKEARMVQKQSGGKRHLQYMVLSNSEIHHLYDVLVAEDNGTNLVNHFAFVVDLDKNKVLNPDGKEIDPSEISPLFSRTRNADSSKLIEILGPNKYKHFSVSGKRKK